MNPILQTLRMKNIVVDDLEEMLGQLTGDEKRLWAAWQIDDVVSDKIRLNHAIVDLWLIKIFFIYRVFILPCDVNIALRVNVNRCPISILRSLVSACPVSSKAMTTTAAP